MYFLYPKVTFDTDTNSIFNVSALDKSMEKGDKIFTTKGQRYLSREDTKSIGHEA